MPRDDPKRDTTEMFGTAEPNVTELSANLNDPEDQR